MPSREEVHQRGVSALNRGQHARARALLERARDGLEPGDLLARIDGSLAYLWSETGERARALELCAVALRHPGLTRATRGVLSSQTGLLLMLSGERDAALRSFGDAIEVLEDPHHLARAHLNRGGVHLQRTLLGPAADDFTRAREHYVAAGDDYGAAKALHNLGYTRLLAGDLVAALDDLAAAYPAFSSQGPVMTAMADQDRAEALVAAGLLDEGRAALRAAARAYGSRRLYQRRGEAELALARTLVQTSPREAGAAARRAGAQFDRSAAPAWRLRADTVALAAAVEAGATGPALVGRAAELAERLERHGLHWDAVSVGLHATRVQLRRGDLTGARARLVGLRTGGRSPLGVRLLARDVRAELATLDGRRAAALGHVRAGLVDLHAWQSSFGSLDLQTMVVGQGTRLGVRGLALAVASGSPEVLLEWSERARMLASRVQPVRAPQSEEIVAGLAELRELAGAAGATGGTGAGRRTGSPAGREAELRGRVRELSWRHRGSGQVTEPCSLAELQAGLAAGVGAGAGAGAGAGPGEGAALVAYVVTADRVAGLVVTAQGAVCRDLGDRAGLDRVLGGLHADLDMAAAELPQTMAGFVRRQLAERLSALAALLVTPLLGDLGERRVVLTPSGVLAGVPWTLLPGLVGRPVSVAQSATTWLARSTTPLRLGRAGFVAGPRVVRAEAEVRAVSEHWVDAEVLSAEEATARAVSALAARVDVLHVAAHGRHSAQNPMFAGVQLVDGPWFGYDIDQLAAVPDVVLLSACEVGRSSVRWGEELIGMSAAWLHAGARCVVASAAAVADDTAYDVLLGVHEHLAAGVDPEQALARAVGAVVDGAAPAPFVCFR